MNGVVLGGTSSGVGKTVATLTVVRAMQDAGYDVQPAKAGPDFIDPSHHAAVADRPSRTLDVWLSGREGARRNYHRGEGEFCVVEGVMGLYDGSKSSTAMVAEALDLPVVLVVDATAGMESVAATALGFREYAARANRDIAVAGVLVQQAHGGRHASGIREALPDELTYCGRIPPDDDLVIPERHLGLHRGTEAPLPDAALQAAAESVRVDRLASLAETPPEPRAGSSVEAGVTAAQADDRDVTVAVARDEAFSFLYPAVAEHLREHATVRTVSPVAGDPLGPADAVYLPGGYPELYVESLANSETLADIASRAEEGVPVYGECGGFMALCESLTTAEGETAEMAGVLPAQVEMQDRYQALDHVELAATGTGPVPTGETLHGHEFHYSAATVARDARFAFEMGRGEGINGTHDGLVEHRTVGTYCHCHVTRGPFGEMLSMAAERTV